MEVDSTHQAFLRLFSSNSGDLYAFVRCLAPLPSDTDDLFQELSLRLWAHFDAFDHSRPFLPWARGVARMLVMEQRRRSQRSLPLSDRAIESIADTFEGLDDTFVARQSALDACLAKLNDRDRELLRMRYHDRCRPAHIAEAMERSIYAIYRSLARIHRALSQCVRKTMEMEA